ncbi:MAG: redoxin domain-containing protein [Planctomycetota bacterium]|jgi:peroxiredoxin
MKRTPGLFLMICAAASAAAIAATAPALAGEEPQKAELGKPAPDFTLVDTKSVKRTLSESKGKLVILEWTNPQCPFVVNCYRSKAMQTTYDRVKALDKGVVWLAINTTYGSSVSENELWIKRHGLKYPILLDFDGHVGRLYDARRTPQMFVIDTEGVLRYHGAIDDNPSGSKPVDEVTNYVVNAVQQIVDGETVTPVTTKPYGCTVKYRLRSR